MKELKVSEENVLKAADKCPQAKEVLKELFPEVFDKDEIFCYTDSILKCVHKNYTYAIIRRDHKFFMYNMTQARFWSNGVDARPVQDRHFYLRSPKDKAFPVTKGEFLELIAGTTSSKLSDWKFVI